MRTIYKYPLKIQRLQTLSVPKFFMPIKIDWQGDNLCLWAEVDTDLATGPIKIAMFGTGHELLIDGKPFDASWHIDTIQQGDFVWHFFLVDEVFEKE